MVITFATFSQVAHCWRAGSGSFTGGNPAQTSVHLDYRNGGPTILLGLALAVSGFENEHSTLCQPRQTALSPGAVWQPALRATARYLVRSVRNDGIGIRCAVG